MKKGNFVFNLKGIAHKGTATIQNAVVLRERSKEKTGSELAMSWKKLKRLNHLHLTRDKRVDGFGWKIL
nr:MULTISPECIES: hypothetical protein [unclassified Bacillus cereus group]